MKRDNAEKNELAFQRVLLGNRAAELAGLIAEAQEERERRFVMLEQIVRSEQMPHEDVQKLLMDDQAFATWYKVRHP